MKWLPNVFGQGICHYSYVSYTTFGVIIIQLLGRVSGVFVWQGHMLLSL